MPQHGGVRAPAPEEEGIQGTVGDKLDGCLLTVFEHVLQDARDAASQLGIILLSSQVKDDPETDASNIVPVSGRMR